LKHKSLFGSTEGRRGILMEGGGGDILLKYMFGSKDGRGEEARDFN
jgi:hypothetical protein